MNPDFAQDSTNIGNIGESKDDTEVYTNTLRKDCGICVQTDEDNVGISTLVLFYGNQVSACF